jgi:sec-independent protein translocase protein TatB
MGWVRKARMLAREFQDGVDDVVRQADLEDIKKEVSEVGDFELGKEFKDSLDLSDDLDVDAIESDVEDALSLEPAVAEKPAGAKKTTAAAKTPRRTTKATAKKKPASPAKGRTRKKGTAASKAAARPAKAPSAKAAPRRAKSHKAARPKKKAGA